MAIKKYSFFLRVGPSYSSYSFSEQFCLILQRNFCMVSKTGISNNETRSLELASKTKEAFPVIRCRNPWIKSNRAQAGKWDQEIL